MTRVVQRHWRIFRVFLTEVMHFRLRALVWFLVGSINTIILLLFWIATLRANNQALPAELPAITSYYLLMLIFGTVTICHHEDDIAYRDVYQGKLSQYLLRPYPYLLTKFHQEIVWRVLMGGWAFMLITLLILFKSPIAITHDPSMWFLAAVAVVLGMMVSFFLQSLIGLTSIWLTNIKGLLELTSIMELLLAGFVVPLSLAPATWQTWLLKTPYAATTFTPVSLLTQSLTPPEIAMKLGVQVFWLIVLALASQWLFRSGIKQYSGVSQ